MEQKTIQINIEERLNGIQSFMVYQVCYLNEGEDSWHSWLTYLEKKNALLAVRTLRNLPEVKFACVDSVQVFI